jgi:hypothetical protein
MVDLRTAKASMDEANKRHVKPRKTMGEDHMVDDR